MDWLITDEQWDEYTGNGEWDVVMCLFWDNGIISPKSAEQYLHSVRYEYINKDCPKCQDKDKHYELNDGRTKCKKCGLKFSMTSMTYIDYMKLEPYQIFRFAWLVGCIGSLSSHKIGKDLGISQKSAYYMLEKLRESRKDLLRNKRKFKTGAEVMSFDGFYEVLQVLLSRRREITNPTII